MRKEIILSLLVTIMLILLGCGDFNTETPIGSTGGGENGYGSQGGVFDEELPELLTGRWTPPIHYEETRFLTLYSDGSANYSIYDLDGPVEITEGTWWANAVYFEINIPGFVPQYGWYRASETDLYLYTSETSYYYIRDM